MQSHMLTHAHLLLKEVSLLHVALKTFVMLSQIKYIVIIWYKEKFLFYIIAHCIFTIHYYTKLLNVCHVSKYYNNLLLNVTT